MQLNELKLRFVLSAALLFNQILVFLAQEMAQKEPDSRLVDPLFHLTNKLFRQVRQEKKNIIMSPLSIHSALNMILMGAKSGSITEKELIETLGYSRLNGTLVEAYQSHANLLADFKKLNQAASDSKQKSPPPNKMRRRRLEDKYTEMDAWNMAILKNNAEPLASYVEDVKLYHSSVVQRVRDDKPEGKIELVESANRWAKDAGFDSQVIKKSDLDERFSILLLSAIKVQGYWLEEFSELDAEDAFYNNGKELVKKVRCLSDRDLKQAKYLVFTKKQPSDPRQAALSFKEQRAIEDLAGPTFHAVDIALKDKISFTIFEPLTNGTGKELSELEDHLLEVDSNGNQFKLHRVLKLLDDKVYADRLDYIRFPKFKFESDLELISALKSIGLQRVFSNQAELSGIAQDSLRVDQVKHQAVIEVNQLGIKAAGLTSVRVVPLALRIPIHPIRLLIKHPFMFIVRYNKVPLFIGHLVKI